MLFSPYRFMLTGRQHLSENLLLRDTLYLLQGISGKYVRFSPADHLDPQNKLIFVDDSVCVLDFISKE